MAKYIVDLLTGLACVAALLSYAYSFIELLTGEEIKTDYILVVTVIAFAMLWLQQDKKAEKEFVSANN